MAQFLDAVNLFDPSLAIDLIRYAVGGASITDFSFGGAHETMTRTILPLLSAIEIILDFLIFAPEETIFQKQLIFMLFVNPQV